MTCATCLFWRRKPPARSTGAVSEFGSCHRHAPRPTLLTLVVNLGEPSDVKWPITGQDDGCGEQELGPQAVTRG